MAKSIESFTLVRSTEGYLLQIEDEDGDSTEFIATYDQLELMADEIERYLDQDEDDDIGPDDEDELGDDDESDDGS